MKKIFYVLLFMLVSFVGINYASAFTISENGKYAVVYSSIDGYVDGVDTKVIKFDFDDDEELVRTSDFIKLVKPFSTEYIFSHWTLDAGGKKSLPETLTKSDFTSEGFAGDITFKNGISFWAQFSTERLENTGTYYIVLDGYAGTVNGENRLILSYKANEFKTVNLMNYISNRKGYTFYGWGLDGKIVTSVDATYFKAGDAITLTALFKKDKFENGANDYTLILNANGGTIDGALDKKYDYITGENSGTNMPIFHYIPIRKGYKFVGWNTRKDGSGKDVSYMYWRMWFTDSDNEYEKDTLLDNGHAYKNLTLYARWEKTVDEPDEVKEIKSSTNIDGKITFEDPVSSDYVLDIREIEISDKLKDKNVKYLVDINLTLDSEIVSVNNLKMTIKLLLPTNLLGYDNYKIEDGYIIFETDHLSNYGVIATKNPVINPKTGDNIMTYVVVAIISLMGLVFLYTKRKAHK